MLLPRPSVEGAYIHVTYFPIMQAVVEAEKM